MRRLVTLQWLGKHVLMVVLVLVFLRLGLWQWHRAESNGGSAQNFGYALEWPTFALVVVVVWARFVLTELRGTAPQPKKRREPVVRVGLPTQSPVAEDDGQDDPELAAYNEYLAWLNAREGRPTEMAD